jgi:tetrahydromethanopterin S-methyltransferase subunit C
MFAVIAAVLFALALIFDLTGTSLGNLGPTAFMLAGLLCIALHLAGVATAWRGGRRWRRR